MNIYYIENIKVIIELLMKDINDWIMMKKKLLKYFRSKNPKQFVDYKTLLDIFYKCLIMVIQDILINHLNDYNWIFIKVEIKDEDIDQKYF